ncbi:MAG TPA: glycoside hydrolase family 32 protein [Polyangiaceae bacterium]|nr:glycoside hydrolase family 32 protein [Polyangiaceae bacterium]
MKTLVGSWCLLAWMLLACSESQPGSSGGGANAGTAGDAAGGTAGGSGNVNAGTGATSGGDGTGGSASAGAPSAGSGDGAGATAGGTGGGGGTAGSAGMPMIPKFPDDATFPYVITNYDEPYRPQVHFSAPMGWLNDANGMWFEGGLYHLSYQAFPYSIDEGPKHWGHASSPDLVHWTHWPIMLDPGVNVPGDAWSGSTVVDETNSSGFEQGAGPVLVTLYTCTTQGTCVAYSNDRGVTWQAYDKNPVAIGGSNADTRDPHVFWHEPTKKWVCALFEDGISFYTSTDLKNWSKVSHVDFGFECPDIYELPVDGVANKTKWVLQDASGAYLLGSFDGTTFTPDSLDAEHLDTSGVFYAAQTFYRKNFPDQRVVQMPWLRGMNGATAPFNQAIGFPLQVQLKTFPNGVRVARTPVAEIEKLYTSSQHFDAQTIAPGSNPFAAARSRVFDLEVDLDLGKTTAKTITLGLGDLSVELDVAGQKLFGATVSPINGHLKLRVVRDWGQYELFANDGQVVHTDAHPFAPNNSGISLTGDSAIGLASADLHELGRAWPGNAAKSSVILDDNDGSVTYEGAWTLAPENRYFKASAHYNTSGTAFEVQFTGTRVEWYGLKNTDLGFADVYLDSALVGEGIDCYDPRRQNALLFTQGKLTNTAHTLKVVVTGQKNPASSGTALVHDYVVAYVD